VKWLANLLDRFLDRIAPLPDLSGPAWLSDHEADRDDWLADELLAAHMSHRPGASPDSGVSEVTPDLVGNAALASAATADRVGPLTDEQRIQELLADYEVFLRDVFRRYKSGPFPRQRVGAMTPDR